ncbi:hypothetical protein BST65_08830 [Bradyrhizobium canariense]|nr:hypothetical protein [Bradyrhizobium canariense]OSI26669.1 hypothetical protein BST66_35370 [Bradyrhizobium canariense]OSI29212.1 hypothetical protein BST65_08830 [Bradyrhizobium canariense]OSI44189.1 hypothetical protein BSZ20_14680 [Bradyrhizobium canariense]OSI51940.1 hypothetical protein BST67_11495 [Bradyrhizobium canariense]OSI54396.1 hypothetical protein BSZ15_22695 [Bradyrhizobium canariense]
MCTIRDRYFTQIFVDEATDLSAVQLACTVGLADPALRSWFACGDLRQRITSRGIRNNSEIEWLGRTTDVKIDLRNINMGYRQSQKLRELSDAIATLLDGDSHNTGVAKESDEANAWPLLGEQLSGVALAEWSAARIGEVEDSVGHLPSIAIFIDGDGPIDALVENIRPVLAVRNIAVTGCKDGKVVGHEREVRVFDLQHTRPRVRGGVLRQRRWADSAYSGSLSAVRLRRDGARRHLSGTHLRRKTVIRAGAVTVEFWYD